MGSLQTVSHSGATLDLAYSVGEALGDETCAKSQLSLRFAPISRAHSSRHPYDAQQAAFSWRSWFRIILKDPVFNGNMAAYINGIQRNGIAATIGQCMASDQEFEGFGLFGLLGTGR
ncbi:hypothetical protein J3R83DRAFT_757 [Lanmaoa asiatica]|nr:hypothetical protein J3R83DRAFT_757 [Lanmaoa asiatica]